MTPEIRLPENNKKPGVYYALTDDGVELPVIDVTHPSFTVVNPPALPQRIEKAIEEWKRHSHAPKPLRVFFLWLFSRQSFLMQGIRQASGTFLSGMSTYMMKLGPDNMGTAYSKKFDKVIAASIPTFFIRMRLQEIARLMSEAINPMLASAPPASLHFINIAGGPCSDSINTLILLNKRLPHLLDNRVSKIHVLDLHGAAPAFGVRALEALKSSGAPLQGVNVSLEYVPYNWSQPEKMRDYLKGLELKNSIVAVSSEGGLFDYGGDDEIIANLDVLHQSLPETAVFFGTLTPAEGKALAFAAQTGNSSVVRRSIRGFKDLTGRASWIVKEHYDQTMHYIVELRKRQP
jgi:hypothetical protein